jgi:hypothetical protein
MEKEKKIKPPFDLANLRDLFWQAIEEAGWEPYLEDDYDDFKLIFGSRKEPLADAFTRMALIVFCNEGDPTKLIIRFQFFADPGLRRQKDFTFTTRAARSLFKHFKDFCLGAMIQACTEIGREDEVSINCSARSSATYKVNFGSGAARRAACVLEAGYSYDRSLSGDKK